MVFCKLSDLNEGCSATIRAIEQDEISLKLLEIGIIPGEVIRMDINKSAKGPFIVHIGGATISLRLDEAETIVVELNI